MTKAPLAKFVLQVCTPCIMRNDNGRILSAMRKIDRFNLIDKIGRELQSRMTFSDIDVYLSGFGIDCSRSPSENSKWIYVKELLADVEIDRVLEIADELELEYPFVKRGRKILIEPSFWRVNHFRLFISHLSNHKKNVVALQKHLLNFGISAFVAHEDIEATKEWQEELEHALLTMDALAALLSPDFHESQWTDQEIGAAIGRGLLIIPLKYGEIPYGFIQKYQALNVQGKFPSQVASEIFSILISHKLTRSTLLTALSKLLTTSSDSSKALLYLSYIANTARIDSNTLEVLKTGIEQNSYLIADESFIDKVNEFFRDYDFEEISKDNEVELTDDIPF